MLNRGPVTWHKLFSAIYIGSQGIFLLSAFLVFMTLASPSSALAAAVMFFLIWGICLWMTNLVRCPSCKRSPFRVYGPTVPETCRQCGYDLKQEI